MNIKIKLLAVFVTVAFAATFARAQNIPSIIVQPSSQATAPGGTISFSVSASGAGTLAYLWAKNTTNLANGTFSGRATVSGATTSTLMLTTCTTNDQANYTCHITNSFGSITSSIASLTVYIPPTISTQPIGHTNAVGSNITFSVVASGSTPFTYVWQYNNATIPSATLNVYSINNAATNNSGSYTVAVSNPAGTVNSSAANLLILAPPVITTQPANTTVIVSNSATFLVTSTGSLLHYQWQQNGVPINGATNASYSITNASYLLNGYSYNVVITNYLKNVTSSSATLSVVGMPVIYSSLNQGLAAYYLFNGNANDASGNGNNGTNYGATLTTDRFGNTNAAYSFNGSSYINVGSVISDYSTMTFSVWFQTSNFVNGKENGIVMKERNDGGIGARLGVYGANNDAGYNDFLNNISVFSANSIQPDWHQAVFVNNGSSVSV